MKRVIWCVILVAIQFLPSPSYATFITTVTFTGSFTVGGVSWRSGVQTFDVDPNGDATNTSVTFHDPNGASQEVVFQTMYEGTTTEPNGMLSDLVRITYLTLFGTTFLHSSAFFDFDGHHDSQGVPIDRVVDYTREGFFTDGFTLLTDTFPINLVAFSSTGVPSSAFFVLNYSYAAPCPPQLAQAVSLLEACPMPEPGTSQLLIIAMLGAMAIYRSRPKTRQRPLSRNAVITSN